MKQDKLPKCGSSARVDKWLWAARIYKTRSVAADAIKNGRVTIEGSNVKPSRTVKEGDIISVKKPPITYSFKILACIEQRVGAKLLPQVFENVTDPKQYELLEMSRISGFIDRAIDNFIDPVMFGWDDDDDEDDNDDNSDNAIY